MPDRASDALRRLLADASAGGQAKVDALVALSQRTLFVPTWRIGEDTFRTVVSSAGVAALPVWLDLEALEAAARLFGWALPDGRVPAREVGARAAMTHAVANGLLLLVEMGSDHVLEVDGEEMRPLLTPQARRESAGPFAVAGRTASTLLQAVKAPTPSGGTRPPSVRPPPGYVPAGDSSPGELAAPSVPAGSAASPAPTASAPTQGGSAARAPSAVTPPAAQGATPPAVASATFGGPSGGVSIGPLGSPPTDALLDALSAALRGYPEVEWAMLASVARGPAAPVPAVVMRLTPAFRTRVDEIVTATRRAAASQGAALDVLLLDEPSLMRAARAAGAPFYPWRR
jgi:hypothetical protein